MMLVGVPPWRVDRCSQFGQFGNVSAGRRPDLCWEFRSDEREQHREIATYCKLCRVIVRLHGKVDKVKSHLRGCKPLKKLLDAMVSSDIPKWMTKQGQRERDGAGKHSNKKRNSESNLMYIFLNRRTDDSSAYDTTATPSTLGASTVASGGTRSMKTKTMKDFIPPAMRAHAKAEFHKSLARMEEMHLIQALKQLCPDVTLLSRRDLSGKLLQHAYKEENKKVDGWLD